MNSSSLYTSKPCSVSNHNGQDAVSNHEGEQRFGFDDNDGEMEEAHDTPFHTADELHRLTIKELNMKTVA